MRGILLAGLVIGTGGCLMAGNYHSAKTLEEGESRVGMTFSQTQYRPPEDPGVSARTVESANPFPEVAYHIGLADNLEVGGRAGLLLVEGDVKYRFYQSDKLHLAIAPAISYQSLGSIRRMKRERGRAGRSARRLGEDVGAAGAAEV